MWKILCLLSSTPLASSFVVRTPSKPFSCSKFATRSSLEPLFSIPTSIETRAVNKTNDGVFLQQGLEEELVEISKRRMVIGIENDENAKESTGVGDNDEEEKDSGTTMFQKFASPAEFENSKFICDENVQFWMDLNRDGSMEPSDFIQEIVNVGNRFASKGRDAVTYWIRHTARSGYFVTNALLGTVGSTLHERLVKNSSDDEEKGDPAFIDTLAKPKVISRLLLESALSYEQDYQRIADGKHKPPHDMYTSNRQKSPIFFGQQTVRFVNEAIGTLSRRNRGSEEDKRTWISGIKSDLYPDYFQNAFHYQTDGWMSQDSANVYETSTETLFLGRQDAMQRTALVPLVQYSKDRQNNASSKPLKVLEVACGTGRFLTFARDNLPMDTEFTAVDLSPFYLDKARDNDKNWRSIRKNTDMPKIRPARMVQAKAEDLPFDDEEFDAVVCMYLYHEVPRDIRAQIASEMARVTKSGGHVILTDSNQLGDRPFMDATMGNFEKMNEPHYVDYIEDLLPLHFENVGLECLTKTVCSTTKTLAFRKPLSQPV